MLALAAPILPGHSAGGTRRGYETGEGNRQPNRVLEKNKMKVL